MNPIRREEASAYEQLRDVMAAKLVKPCILAGSEPGDVVLDPFAGAGTVAGCGDRGLRCPRVRAQGSRDRTESRLLRDRGEAARSRGAPIHRGDFTEETT